MLTPIHRTGPIPGNPSPGERQERALALMPIVTIAKELVEEAQLWIREGEEIQYDRAGWRSVWNAARCLETLLFPIGRKDRHIATFELLGPNWVKISDALELVMERFDEFLNSFGWLNFFSGKSDDVPKAPLRSEPNAVGKLDAATENLAKKVTQAEPKPIVDATRDAANTVGSGSGNSKGVIHFLGDRQYRINNWSPITLTDNEDTVLQAFLLQSSMDGPTLAIKAGFERAARVLRDLRNKYESRFGPAISVPGTKGAGGYCVAIQSATIAPQ